jgi:hypothetical protein
MPGAARVLARHRVTGRFKLILALEARKQWQSPRIRHHSLMREHDECSMGSTRQAPSWPRRAGHFRELPDVPDTPLPQRQ